MLQSFANLSFWVRLLLIFASLVLGLLVIPWFVTAFQSGTRRFGFPIRFYFDDRSPPPFNESRFEPWGFIADLAIYCALALILAAVAGRFRG